MPVSVSSSTTGDWSEGYIAAVGFIARIVLTCSAWLRIDLEIAAFLAKKA